MMEPRQLLNAIIRPALAVLGAPYDSESAAILLLATAAQESLCGHYVHQLNGPALGIYQMEPATYDDTQRRVGARYPAAMRVARGGWPVPLAERLVYDLRYATQIARLKYYLDPEALPEPADIAGMFSYYKRVWNTPLGAATEDQFRARWARYVSPALEGL